jgi:hypothetical protein
VADCPGVVGEADGWPGVGGMVDPAAFVSLGVTDNDGGAWGAGFRFRVSQIRRTSQTWGIRVQGIGFDAGGS